MSRLPTYFLSHGGGPWPWVDGMRDLFARSAQAFSAIPGTLPQRPKAVLMITGHWEAPGFAVSTGEHPPMDYDYSGFPPHTYALQYPAPGHPALAARVMSLMQAHGLSCVGDPTRGYDHGTFVPLHFMFPQADVPVVLLSLKHGYDVASHLKAGEAIAPLRDEGVLIVGSGLTFHNMRGFGQPSSTPVAQAFEHFLHEVVTMRSAAMRHQALMNWTQAPGARQAHPREDHLLPLMVVAGAAGDDPGQRVLLEHALAVDMGSYRFG